VARHNSAIDAEVIESTGDELCKACGRRCRVREEALRGRGQLNGDHRHRAVRGGHVEEGRVRRRAHSDAVNEEERLRRRHLAATSGSSAVCCGAAGVALRRAVPVDQLVGALAVRAPLVAGGGHRRARPHLLAEAVRDRVVQQRPVAPTHRVGRRAHRTEAGAGSVAAAEWFTRRRLELVDERLEVGVLARRQVGLLLRGGRGGEGQGGYAKLLQRRLTL